MEKNREKNLNFYANRLVSIESEMKACKLEMDSGIDYDYNQGLFDEFSQQREDVRLDLASYRRRTSLDTVYR